MRFRLMTLAALCSLLWMSMVTFAGAQRNAPSCDRLPTSCTTPPTGHPNPPCRQPCKVPCPCPDCAVPQQAQAAQAAAAFAAPPPGGEVGGPTRSTELNGLSLTFPELTLRMPSIRFPSFTRYRRDAHVNIDADRAYATSAGAQVYGPTGYNAMLTQAAAVQALSAQVNATQLNANQNSGASANASSADAAIQQRDAQIRLLEEKLDRLERVLTQACDRPPIPPNSQNPPKPQSRVRIHPGSSYDRIPQPYEGSSNFRSNTYENEQETFRAEERYSSAPASIQPAHLVTYASATPRPIGNVENFRQLPPQTRNVENRPSEYPTTQPISQSQAQCDWGRVPSGRVEQIAPSQMRETSPSVRILGVSTPTR